MFTRVTSLSEDIKTVAAISDTHPLIGTNLYRSFITQAPFVREVRACNSRQELDVLVRKFCTGMDNFFKIIPRIKNEILPTHPLNVSRNAVAIGLAMGLSLEQLRFLRYAGLLHDIGKAPIPDGILKAPRLLTLEEKAIIRRHPTLSKETIEKIPMLASNEAIIALLHHEAYDGSGYLNYSGTEIPIEAHIMIIADSFDAMVNDRPYNNAKTKKTYPEALTEILRCSVKQFDPEAVKGFLVWAENGFPDPLLDEITFYDRFMQEVPETLPMEDGPGMLARLLIDLYVGVADFLVELADKRDGLNTRGYETNESARHCVQLAKVYGLSVEQQRRVYMYGLIGGVYDMYIPDEIEDPTEYRREVWVLTREIFSCIPGYEELTPIVDDIFEDYDGKNSLHGKSGQEICIEARVTRVALTYVQLGLDKVIERQGNVLDPEVVRVFLKRLNIQTPT